MNISKIEKRIGVIKSHWSSIYDDMRDDWNVYYLDQWKDDQKTKRANRIMVTDDFCRPYIKQVISNTYQNPGFIKLNARNQGGELKARALQEALRYIEDKSDSGDVKSHAIECAAVAGLGFIKLSYETNNTDENDSAVDIYMDKVIDPLNVYIDDKSVEIDGHDMKDAVIYHDSEDHYTYYKKVKNVVTWYEVKDGKIKDKEVFPSAFVPIVPVYGEMGIIQGDRNCFGIMRALKDIQREHNYIKSDVLERIALTPMASTIIDSRSVSPEQEQRIRNSANVPETVIKYNGSDDKGDVLFPAPVQNTISPNIAYSQMTLASIENSAKTSTGIYTQAPNLSQESGIAIAKKQMNTDRGQLVYDAHLKSSQKHIGTIGLQMIEVLYEDELELPIQNERGVNSLIKIGGQPTDIMGNPIPMITDLNMGDSSISISSQPAFTTRKEEGIQKIFDILPKLPVEVQMKIWPELVKDLDFPNAKRYSVLMGGEDEDNQQDPRMLQQQLAQMNQQLALAKQAGEKMANENLRLQTEIQTQSNITLTKARMDNNTKYQIEKMKIDANSISDDKDLIEKELKYSREADAKRLAELNKKQIADDKIAAEARKQNKAIMSETLTNINTITEGLV